MTSRNALCLFALISSYGCADLTRPNWLHPGSAEYQQKRAERFDPYPLPDAGPDTAARPLQYTTPAPINERAQNETTFIDRYRQPPPPGIYRQPRTQPTQQIFVPPPGYAPPAISAPIVTLPENPSPAPQ